MLKLSTYRSLLLLTCAIGFSNCLDFEEEALQGSVIVIAPIDSLTSNQLSNLFAWEEIDEADEYELTIVSPSFLRTESLEFRGTSEIPELQISLNEGEYEWEVKATNSISEISSGVQKLFIIQDSSSNLLENNVTLVAPVPNGFIPDTNITLLWRKLQGIDEYIVEVSKPNFLNSLFSVSSDTVLQDFHYAGFLEDGEYSWRVAGKTELGYTEFSESAFTIDRVGPEPPLLESPADKQQISGIAELNWTTETNAISELEIRADSINGTSILRIDKTSSNHTFSAPELGTYFWKVVPTDQAGNIGISSDWREFEIVQ